MPWSLRAFSYYRGKGHLNDNVKMSLDQKEKLEKQISDSPSVLQENPAYSIHHSMAKNIYHCHKIITSTCIIIELYLLLLCVHASARGYGHMDVAESLGHYDYICTGPCSGAELTVNSLK